MKRHKSRDIHHDGGSTLEKARNHFDPVLREGFSQDPAFLLAEDDRDLVRGAITTAVLPLTGFIKLFGDLVDASDFRIDSYKKRNKEKNFCIPETVFDKWKDAGCLQD